MIQRSESPERLFQQLDDLVADIINQFASHGQGTALVIGTLQDVLAKRQLAFDRDPDPAEDDVAEPANDWPGADSPRATAKE
jgi:hypothetical protein